VSLAAAELSRVDPATGYQYPDSATALDIAKDQLVAGTPQASHRPQPARQIREGAAADEGAGVGEVPRGLVPQRYDAGALASAAQKEQYGQRSAAVVSDKTSLLAEIKTAGEKPSKLLIDAYDLRLERAHRLDKIHAHGLAYQQKAYKADIGLLVERGAITKDEAAATLKAAEGASESELKSWCTWLSGHKFGGDVIGPVKRYPCTRRAGQGRTDALSAFRSTLDRAVKVGGGLVSDEAKLWQWAQTASADELNQWRGYLEQKLAGGS
jgi:hypothetical protein